MANLADIKKAGEELVPLIKDLFSLARGNKTKEDRSKEIAVVTRLQKLTAEAQSNTSANLVERTEAIVSNHTALTEVLIEAATSHSIVTEAELLAVRVQRDALANSLGRLFERAAFDPISQLLDNNTISEIANSLKRAEDDIVARSEAKAVLDSVIGVAMTAAKIATKLATL